MEDLTKIQIWLSSAEWEALRIQAQGEYRHPREQARYIIRSVLLGERDSVLENSKGTASQTWQGESNTFATA